jgi:tetratricopeptide (TPR) repeat protein
MKPITRMILRRLVSGGIELTPQLFDVLKELEQDQPSVAGPGNEKAPATPIGRPCRSIATDETRLTLVSPLPGRWIRRTGCVAGMAFLLAIGLARATSVSSDMAAANNAFAQGHYAEAARGYEAILAQQGYSVPVLFNLANAQQRAGRPGRAILNYERAALLSPNDSDIAANLRVTRQKAGVELEHISAFQTAANMLTMNAWFTLAAVALFLFAMSWPLKLLQPQARRILNVCSVMAVFALMIATGVLGLRCAELNRAVVVAPEAVAGVSPVTVAEPVFQLRAGEIVSLQQTHGGFALVRNHAGHEGWVDSGKIKRIIPANF